MGGLSRRNQVVKERRDAGPVVVVDAGRSLAKAASTNRLAPDAAQRLGKAGLVAEALAAGGVDAITLGAEDWSLGTDAVRSMVEDLPVLAANLWCDGEKPYPGHVVVERGGKRVAIVGVTDGDVEGCEVRGARVALVAELAALEPVDLTVALLPVGSQATIKIVGEGLDVDLIVDAHRTRMSSSAEMVGSSLVVGSGPKGQRVGVTTLDWVEGATTWKAIGGGDELSRSIERTEQRIAGLRERDKNDPGSMTKAITRLEDNLAELQKKRDAATTLGPANTVTVTLVELDDAVANHEPTEALVQAFLTSMDEAAPAAAAPTGPRTAPVGSAYAGSATCTGCHPSIAVQWSTTSHAHAWKSLVDDGHAADADCFSCHATGVGEKGGPARPADVGGLRDVQCEACHGPARAHSQDPTNAAVLPVRSPPQETCTGCHDGERDQGQFDWATYLPKVTHATPAKEKH